MEELKEFIILGEIKNNKIATETAKEIFSVNGQDVITDRHVRKMVFKVHSADTSLWDEPQPGASSGFDQNALSN